MKVTEIAFSTYPVLDMDRARAFYEGVLGLKVTMNQDMGESGHWIEYDIGAGTLGLGRYEGWKPTSDGCTVGLEVDDFDTAIEKIKAAGATFKMGPFETPICHMAIVLDPEGNSLCIHKRKPGHH
jgi:predicted enzyme related to lactoylglutathione lyase